MLSCAVFFWQSHGLATLLRSLFCGERAKHECRRVKVRVGGICARGCEKDLACGAFWGLQRACVRAGACRCVCACVVCSKSSKLAPVACGDQEPEPPLSFSSTQHTHTHRGVKRVQVEDVLSRPRRKKPGQCVFLEVWKRLSVWRCIGVGGTA